MLAVTASIAVAVIVAQASGGKPQGTRFAMPALSMPGISAGLTRSNDGMMPAVDVSDQAMLAELGDLPQADTDGFVDSQVAPELAGDADPGGMQPASMAPSGGAEVAVLYEVEPGDTALTIAGARGISVESILYNNPLIADPDVLVVGQKLLLPAEDGIIHWVRLGETVRSIANNYQVVPDTIFAFPGNQLAPGQDPAPGSKILVPGGTPSPGSGNRVRMVDSDSTPVPTETPAATPTDEPTVEPTDTVLPTETPAVTETPVPTDTPQPERTRPPQSRFGFAWPIYGAISSYFGPGHPLGIDIDLFGRAGEAVGASAGGRVIFAGGDPCCSYGLYVIIQHADGFTSTYAHLGGIAVEVGQRVEAGGTVGFAGSTGYSTGVHLHFEIRKDNVPLDPLAYLP